MPFSYLSNVENIPLSWSDSGSPKAIERHRAQLEKLRREGKRAWIRLDAILTTRFWLNFNDYTFLNTDSQQRIQAQVRDWLKPSGKEFDRIYLLAEENASEPCYDITKYIWDCLQGDLDVASRLRGRTVFRIHQIEKTSAHDFLSRTGVNDFLQQVVKRYIHEFAGFLEAVVAGFSCQPPSFLSPFRTPSLTIPWSPDLVQRFESILAVPLLDFLPLLFHETYDSATVRSTFWSGLTRHFAKVCIGELRRFCHQWGLQFAVEIPKGTSPPEIDFGTLINQADLAILTKPDRNFLEQAGDMLNIKQAQNMLVIGHSRVNPFLSMGVPRRPILMISPIHSLWTKPDQKMWNKLIQTWKWLCKTLWDLGYDFDIVSETDLITAEINKSKHPLSLKSTSYPLVLLPGCLSLQEETVDRLTQFVKNRGRLIAVEPMPYLLNGRVGLDPYPLERLLYHRRTSILRGTATEKAERLKRILKKRIKRTVQIYEKPDNHPTTAIRVHHRQSKESDFFYLFNSGEDSIETLIEFQGEMSAVEEWHPITGKQAVLDFWNANGNTYLTKSFNPQQEWMVVTRQHAS